VGQLRAPQTLSLLSEQPHRIPERHKVDGQVIAAGDGVLRVAAIRATPRDSAIATILIGTIPPAQGRKTTQPIMS
jgi:hypothetical protein